MKKKYPEILKYLQDNPVSSRNEIMAGIGTTASPASIKRRLAEFVSNGDVLVVGNGRSTRFKLSCKASIFMPFDIDSYFLNDIDQRVIIPTFNSELISDILPKAELFTPEERRTLNKAQEKFLKNIYSISDTDYRNEIERFKIDMSWKSSQLDGNSYTLLETERLVREKTPSSGRTKKEALMIQNHKKALDFILEMTDYLKSLTAQRIDDIHVILTKDISDDKGIRHRRSGITGTNYTPLEDMHQIEDMMRKTCELINGKEDCFEKALLALALISYIHPYSDASERTARTVTNGILISGGFCPISFRRADSFGYKKALLAFYEQNNLSALKKIFIDQFVFSTKNYF